MTNAMNSYMSLCGNEIVNANRLHTYVGHGLQPSGFDILCKGCDGLDAIIPCTGDEPPPGGYQLPELDDAPWYDENVPESRNFAGLLVTSVTMTGPYSRTVTPNINQGQTLGRLKRNGRTITVTGWLIGKTCCATQYGLRWLTSALAGPPCSGGDCGGCELTFLDCCPTIGVDEGDCLTTDNGVFVRPSGDSEYERAEDFFRRMNGVGIIDGPNVLSCKGSNCGCSSVCAALTEVEFTLATSSPYINSFGTPVLTEEPAQLPCSEEEDCQIEWSPGTGPCTSDDCPEPADCLEDPLCPLPALPPAMSIPTNPCACSPITSTRICAPAEPVREWGSSTLNIDVYSGSKALRNMAIRTWANPTGRDCSETEFDDCDACSVLLISYVPPNSHFILSGEKRTVTIECNGSTRNAMQNVTNADGQPFEWPDLECASACVCVDFDCTATAEDATITIERIDRDL